jgi:beta-galactosidase GanA
VTHSFMGFNYGLINYYDLARELDLVTWDNYSRTQWRMEATVNPAGPALGHDTMRGLKGSNFRVMEQQPGQGGWQMVSMPARPGEMRLWAYQSIAHGADGILFFRWRTALAGAEQYWHGSLDHHAQPGRRFTETRRMWDEPKHIGALGPVALFDALAPWLLALAGVQPVLHVPAGVEATERWPQEQRLLFVLNHTAQEQEIILDREYRDLLDGDRVVGRRVTLPAREVMILT